MRRFLSVTLWSFLTLSFSLSTIGQQFPTGVPMTNASAYATSSEGADMQAQEAQAAEGDTQESGEEETPTVFGADLFQGAFKKLSFNGFNPDYRVGIGDSIQLMLWGGINKQAELVVDPKGNIFIPEVGPVPVSGIRNADLDTIIAERVADVFSDTVESYAVLGSAQPVKVFVTGAITKPGLYGGFSSDSILYYLDQAGGIKLGEGSFIDVRIIRGEKTIERLSLYNFLVDGHLKQIQFADGDRILVRPLRSTFTAEGSVRNPYRFEFEGTSLPIEDALELAQPDPNATTISIERETNGNLQAATYALDSIAGLSISPGDKLTLSSDLKTKSILVNITGEHLGASQQVHPHGATVGDVIRSIEPSEMSNLAGIQLYRKSVAELQKKRIDESLDLLERNILNARSSSAEEARVRAEEAALIMQFIERARNAEPLGHVILGDDGIGDRVSLKDGDTFYIPRHSNLVSIHGQVVFPTTQVWQKGESAKDYIRMSGGLTETADEDRVMVVQTNGVVRSLDGMFRSYKSYRPKPGEELIVLPKPETKNLLFAKDIATILYQVAIAARVAVGI